MGGMRQSALRKVVSASERANERANPANQPWLLEEACCDLVESARAEGFVAWRLRQELFLFERQWRRLALAWAVWYVACPVAMNYAYYRYEAGPLLKDLGFQTVPKMPVEFRYLSEVPFKVLIFIASFMSLCSVARTEETGAYAVNAIVRWSTVFAWCADPDPDPRHPTPSHAIPRHPTPSHAAARGPARACVPRLTGVPLTTAGTRSGR